MATFNYVPLNPYRLYLRLLRQDAVFSTLRRTLAPVGEAIGECSRRIEEAHQSGNDDYADAITDEEVDIIESLIGTAFVICQAHVNAVVARIKGLHRAFRTYQGRPLNLSESRDAILCCGSTPVEMPSYSAVQVIDAFANFFKHGDEWPLDWTTLNNKQKRAGSVLIAVGGASGSTGNLRRGAEVLGNAEYENVLLFANQLDAWHEGLLSAYEKELQSEGVLTGE